MLWLYLSSMRFIAAQQWISISNSPHDTNAHEAQNTIIFKIKVQDANSSISAVFSVTQAANKSVS